MKIMFTSGILALALLSGCATTTPTASQQAKLSNRIALANTSEPAPPAEGPQDVQPGPAQDPNRNPGLVPTPLLRDSAASDTP